MVRINEYGEIIRDDAPPSISPTPPPSPPAPPPRPPQVRNQGRPGPVLGMMIACAVVLGFLGGIVGFVAGNRWMKTEVPAAGQWNKSIRSFVHTVHIASWSSHPVHHAIQDATIPLRVLLCIAAGIGLMVAVFSDGPPLDNEGCGVLIFLGGVIVLGTALVGAVVRLLFYLLALPVTWFVNELSGPWTGLFLVGFCWAVIGAGIGLPIGGIVANRQR